MRHSYEIPRRRIRILFAAFLLFSAAIGYRVVSFQVVQSEFLYEEGEALRYQENLVPPERGDILDTRGRRLATNVPADRVSVIIDKVENPEQLASLLAPIIGRDRGEILALITDPNREWVVLKRRLSPEASQKIAALDLDSVDLAPEPRRVYPMEDFASQLLGFVNYDYQGAYGLEAAYDDIVGGKPGKLIGERDGDGNVIALGKSVWNPPVDGADLVLTIDSAVQRIVEQALDDAIEAQQATGGTIIVQNSKTGAILAMASRPSFDPNQFVSVRDPAVFGNPAVSAAYEPGSTMKAIAMAIGLEAGVVTPNTVHDGGLFKVIPGGAKIYNATEVDYGPETMTEVLQHSSNVGIMYVAQQLAEDRFYRGLVAFGFGQPTGIDLAAQSSGILPLPGDPVWTPANLYTNAFGQGMAVTPVQLVNAVSALANGGQLMEPYVVQEIRKPGGTEHVQPEPVRQVISPETSRKITQMLVGVMDDAYENISVPGYKIAAKTGTAEIPSPDGGYEEDATIGSIVGYGPAEDPQFTVLVKIDRPQESPWGERAAGPAFQKIFKELFLLYGIPPSDPRALNQGQP